jgi:hypothetical protein
MISRRFQASAADVAGAGSRLFGVQSHSFSCQLEPMLRKLQGMWGGQSDDSHALRNADVEVRLCSAGM